MIVKKYSLFDFIEISDWYEIFDFQKPIDYNLFLYFIDGYETYYDQVELNTIHNKYLNKKFDCKIGIDLREYDIDYCCKINFWIDGKHFHSIYRFPYNTFDQHNAPILNGSTVNKIKNYYLSHKNIIFYYTKY